MSICTQIPLEERCPGCPLIDFEIEKRVLEPHEELVVTTNVAILAGKQDEKTTRESYLQDVNATYDRIEKAAGRVSHLVRDIVNWRMVGACQYHEGPVLDEDPGLKERFEKFILSIEVGEI